MKPNQIYESTNNEGTNTKWVVDKKGGKVVGVKVASTDEGYCKGYAVLFCLGELDNTKHSPPDQKRAGLLQVKFEQGKNDTDKLLKSQGLKATASIDKTRDELLDHVVANPGVWQIRVPGHAIAVHTAKDAYYFYDSEEGLFLYKNAADFKKKIKGEYAAGSTAWHAWKIEEE